MVRFFFLFLFLGIASCCSIGGPKKIDSAYVISLKTPRQAVSRFKCAMLYDPNGSEVAYNCLSKNSKKRIPYWKFKYGFNLIDYDKNGKIKLWEVMVDLQVESVEGTDKNHAILVCLASDRFSDKFNQQYSEFVYMVKEGEEWKLDLEKTMMERGYIKDLDKWQRNQGKEPAENDGGGCSLSRAPITSEGLLGYFLPLIVLFGLLGLGKKFSQRGKPGIYPEPN